MGYFSSVPILYQAGTEEIRPVQLAMVRRTIVEVKRRQVYLRNRKREWCILVGGGASPRFISSQKRRLVLEGLGEAKICIRVCVGLNGVASYSLQSEVMVEWRKVL